MAYATGTAATTLDLFNAILAFAVANAGFTEAERRTETISSNSYTVVALKKTSPSTRYWWFRARTNEIWGMPTTGIGANWSGISGRPTYDKRIKPISESFPVYHLFTEGTVVHAAFQNSSGYWQHLSFGDITKYGSWTGGHYFDGNTLNEGSYSNNTETAFHAWLFTTPQGTGSAADSAGSYGKIYIPYNAKNFGKIGDGTAADAANNNVAALGFAYGVYNTIVSASPNSFNGRSPGVPVNFFLRDNRSGGSNLWMPIGYVPNIRLVNIEALAPEDLINTDWMVFPMQSKNVGLDDNYVNSGNYGFAIKKVT